jgi:dolichyl-phosphate beta-glucosyltransferase
MISKLIKDNITFFKYAIVWVSSTIVDIGALFVLVDLVNFNLYPSVAISFLLAVINGFLLNKLWTFEDKSKSYKKQFIKFLIISIFWLILTLISMYILVNIFEINYLISKAITSLIVLFWNYFGNKIWTFKLREEIVLKPFKKDFDIKYSIIIPAYNEGKRIETTLKKVQDYFNNKSESFEIIIVNDWSKDNTIQIVKNFSNGIKIIENPKNMWKWFSIKNWIKNAQWELILFIDADNSTPIENLDKLEKYLDDFDIVIWSRHLKESEILKKQPWYRRFVWRMWNKLINLLLLKWIKDTQCGFKLFKYNCANNVFPFQNINRFGFDIEILFISTIKWYKIKEVPVTWHDISWSRLNPIKDSIKTLFELLYIKINYWFDWYK